MKEKTTLGSTHTAHETRHLARKMKAVRNGEIQGAEIISYLDKLVKERDILMSKLDDCCSYAVIQNPADSRIPVLTKEEAGKLEYLSDMVPTDFLPISKLQLFYDYGLPAPDENELHMLIIILQASINQLCWAIGELKAYCQE